MLFCHITTRIKGRKHDGLLTKKGGRGFPHLVFMDEQGEVITKPAGRSVKAFEKGAQQVGSFMKLRNKADKSDAEKVELLTLEIGFGTVSADEARKRAKELEGSLDDAAKAKLAEGMKVLEARDFEKEIKAALPKKRPASQEEAKAVLTKLGEKFWADYQAGKRPTNNPQGPGQTFYQVMVQYGMQTKQAGPARAGYEGLEKIFGGFKQARPQLDRLKKQVEELEAGGGGGE
ncbi:MAG TPA: hypothetical protein DEA08_06895 [Planctomycetes bacterium]|nr:hypothetical protein [Planctomycetota bacterium]